MLKAVRLVFGGVLLTLGACGLENEVVDDGLAQSEEALEADRDRFGVAESFHTTGAIDFTNPFFSQLGTNARSCGTCHAADMGWTLTTSEARKQFLLTAGLAPLFLPHDEGSRPDADLSTVTKRLVAFGPTLLGLGT